MKPNKNMLNSQAAVIHKNKRNTAGISETFVDTFPRRNSPPPGKIDRVTDSSRAFLAEV